MNLALEKGERVTTGGKGRGEIGGEAGEITGVVADAPTKAWEKGMERLVDGGWQLEKWRYCWWLVTFGSGLLMISSCCGLKVMIPFSSSLNASIVAILPDLPGPSPVPMSPSWILTFLLTSQSSASLSTLKSTNHQNISIYIAAIPSL